MRITRLSDFQRELRETGSYRTHPDCRAESRVRPCGLATVRYAWGVMRVFPCSALAEPLGRLDTAKWAEYCFSSITAAERLGLEVRIDGFEQRQAYDGPVMYLSNHMSMAETIILPPVLLSFGPFSYVAKASLAHLPFLSKAAEHMRMVPISRVSPREDLINILKVGTERIRGGDSFLIYPQGTRCDVFSHGKFSSIGAKLAERAGCPIVPIVVDTRCLPTRKTGLLMKVCKDVGPFDPTKDIRVACGPVIPCGKSKMMHETAFDWMATTLEDWGLPVER